MEVRPAEIRPVERRPPQIRVGRPDATQLRALKIVAARREPAQGNAETVEAETNGAQTETEAATRSNRRHRCRLGRHH